MAAAAEEPATKKAKVDEAEEKVEKFQEPDAAADNRPALKSKVVFETADTTLNVVPTLGGKMLNVLSEAGIGHLLAGARANVGQKSGRYMFEAKVVQSVQSAGQQAQGAFRIGFSTSSSGLIVGEDASSAYFESEGTYVAAKKRTPVKNARFSRGNTVAVVLNLDSKSPNHNTVALYRDGVAAGDPMPLPDDLKDQPLFPHVTFRSASVHVNFGPEPLKALPFKCRMLGSAAASDVSVPASKAPKDGKYDVTVPVAFPDEGTFDWLDSFLEQNPQYVELSDRKIQKWVELSGYTTKAQGKGSNDKPQFNTNVQDLDNMSARKVINAVAPVVPRNYVVMEVKSNLIAAEREALLKKFNYPCYKKTARVVMGEPPEAHKAQVQEKLLKNKQEKLQKEHNVKKQEAIRKKAAAKRAAEAEAKRKEAAKKAAEAKKKKEIEEKKAKGEEVAEEPAAEEEEKKEEPAAEEPEVEEPVPQAELTEEEKQIHFLPKPLKDLTDAVMNSSYIKFTTPGKDEGFTAIEYEWQKASDAKAYLDRWVKNKKLTTRIDDLKPGATFREKYGEFAKKAKEWKDKLTAFKAGPKKAGKAQEKADDIDIFSVIDVSDVGEGKPLFEHFTWEDWMLMDLRFKFCWLVLSFKADTNDDDRLGVPVDHVNFYFQRYYSKPLQLKDYGVKELDEIYVLIKDAVKVEDGVLTSQLADDLDCDIFVKMTEEGRRERQRRIDAGDETARLKFVQPPEPKPAPKPAPKPEAKAPAAKAPAQATPKPAALATATASKLLQGATSLAGTPAPKVAAAPVAQQQKGQQQKGKGKDWGKGWGKGGKGKW